MTSKQFNALVKRVSSKRRAGWTWDEIMDADICTVGTDHRYPRCDAQGGPCECAEQWPSQD